MTAKAFNVAILFCLGLYACDREPLELECAAWGAGELVVTEVRGKQNGADTFGQWIELASTVDAQRQVAGLKLEISRWDGTGKKSIVVRNQQLVVSARGYFVLGRFTQENLPPYVDYGFENEFSADLYADAILTVSTCGVEVDTATWKNLTNSGSWSFDGAKTPDAALNDDESNWCVDRTPPEATDGGTVQAGLPGTPGKKNIECK